MAGKRKKIVFGLWEFNSPTHPTPTKTLKMRTSVHKYCSLVIPRHCLSNSIAPLHLAPVSRNQILLNIYLFFVYHYNFILSIFIIYLFSFLLLIYSPSEYSLKKKKKNVLPSLLVHCETLSSIYTRYIFTT